MVAFNPARGAPVIPRVARSAKFEPYPAEAWVAAFMRKSLCKVTGPVAWVFTLARFHWMSVASVLAVSPVSAPPTRERRADEPEVRAAELMATVPVAVIPERVRLPEKRALPFKERADEGEVDERPRRFKVAS